MSTQDITFTITDVELGDVQSIAIRRSTDDEGNSTVQESVSYQVRKTDGSIWKTANLTLSLNASTVSALVSHINEFVLPAINVSEGFI